MRIWYVIVLGWATLTLAGCRTNPEITRLERENRIYEDQINRLRYRLRDLEDALEATPAPSAKPGPSTEPKARSNSATSEEGPSLSVPSSQRPPSSTREGAGEKPPVDEPPPEVPRELPNLHLEVPKDPLRQGDIPERFRQSDRPGTIRPLSGETSSLRPGARSPYRSYGVQAAGATLPLVDSIKVAQITLNKSLTGGIRTDGRFGNEALLVVIEPRDLLGNLLEAPGDVSVVLLDPAGSDETARIGRWDFTASQTAGMFGCGQDRGIHLELPWTSRPPAHEHLQMYVRYTTRDGRKIQISRPIGINRSGDPPAKWMPVEHEVVARPAEGEADSWRRGVAREDSPPPEPAELPPARPAPQPAKPGLQRPIWSPDRTD